MAVRYSFLAAEDFPKIYQTFVEAFADYHVDVSQMTEQMLFNRAIKNGVDFGSSVGVFEGDRMVAVTVVGVDNWGDAKAAFDIGTGIIPAYRGQGIARRMFEHAVPKLRKDGVEKFVLEVLQVNEPAIKAYTKTGFTITRELDCFLLDPEKASPGVEVKAPIDIRPVGRDALDVFADHLDWNPSWENSFASIRRIPDEVTLYGAFVDAECAGLLVYYPLLTWVMTLVVKKDFRRRGVASSLVTHLVNVLGPGVSPVRLNNVDHSDTSMVSLLKKLGFEFFVAQYEMEYRL